MPWEGPALAHESLHHGAIAGLPDQRFMVVAAGCHRPFTAGGELAVHHRVGVLLEFHAALAGRDIEQSRSSVAYPCGRSIATREDPLPSAKDRPKDFEAKE